MIPMNNKGEIDYQLISLRIITHAIRKQTAIDRLAELKSYLASCTPEQIAYAADCAFGHKKCVHINTIGSLGDEYLELHMRLDKDISL